MLTPTGSVTPVGCLTPGTRSPSIGRCSPNLSHVPELQAVRCNIKTIERKLSSPVMYSSGGGSVGNDSAAGSGGRLSPGSYLSAGGYTSPGGYPCGGGVGGRKDSTVSLPPSHLMLPTTRSGSMFSPSTMHSSSTFSLYMPHQNLSRKIWSFNVVFGSNIRKKTRKLSLSLFVSFYLSSCLSLYLFFYVSIYLSISIYVYLYLNKTYKSWKSIGLTAES